MPWPSKIMYGSPRNYSIGHLHFAREQMRAEPEAFFAMAHPGQEWLMGHALPPFQRPSVWTRAQMVRFVESAVLGLHLGTWVFNVSEGTVLVDGRRCAPLTDHWLIDGQQRLRALDAFFGDEFEVFGEKWSGIDLTTRRKFLNTPFDAFETSLDDVAQLRELYDRLNFGGTPHAPDQRAVADGSAAFPSGDDEAASPGPR